MGAVSESAESCFLLEVKEHKKSESLCVCVCGRLRRLRAVQSRANISAGFWLVRKRQSNFSDKYKLGTRALANSRAARNAIAARWRETQLFMSLTSARRSVRAREERDFEESSQI
jgi:hypothetical protein